MIEFFFRDAYQKYGYDFHYYTGEPVDRQWIEKKLSEMTNLEQPNFQKYTVHASPYIYR